MYKYIYIYIYNYIYIYIIIYIRSCTGASTEIVSPRSCTQSFTEIFTKGTYRIYPGISSYLFLMFSVTLFGVSCRDNSMPFCGFHLHYLPGGSVREKMDHWSLLLDTKQEREIGLVHRICLFWCEPLWWNMATIGGWSYYLYLHQTLAIFTKLWKITMFNR